LTPVHQNDPTILMASMTWKLFPNTPLSVAGPSSDLKLPNQYQQTNHKNFNIRPVTMILVNFADHNYWHYTFDYWDSPDYWHQFI